MKQTRKHCDEHTVNSPSSINSNQSHYQLQLHHPPTNYSKYQHEQYTNRSIKQERRLVTASPTRFQCHARPQSRNDCPLLRVVDPSRRGSTGGAFQSRRLINCYIQRLGPFRSIVRHFRAFQGLGTCRCLRFRRWVGKQLQIGLLAVRTHPLFRSIVEMIKTSLRRRNSKYSQIC